MNLRRELEPMYRNLDGALGSGITAEVVVPMLIERVAPSSVVDLGCGVGSFLKAFIDAGVTDVRGVDVCAFDPSLFVVDPAIVDVGDLNKPVHLGRRFDLALCLEVGGYLPDHDVLVRSLVEHAPVVAFSAAVPSQDLLHQHHGAFPSQWVERFARHDYDVYDPFRPLLWNDDRLPFWFRQNLLLFVHRPHLQRHPALAVQSQEPSPLDIVHPDLYRILAGTGPEASLRLALARLPRIARAKVPRLTQAVQARWRRRRMRDTSPGGQPRR